ncbi:cytochrome P450 [Kribbella deserti]|uniref:Cytochrome P450 n=1 Tax=Kribbella deserti TaxID=1926257 RepID=A0ABV6QPX1_9ACTN
MTIRAHTNLAAQRVARHTLRLFGDPVAELGNPRWHADPYPLLRRMRERGPLWKSLSGTWVATSYDVCSALLRDRRIGVRHADGRPPYRWPGPVEPPWVNTFLEQDPPDHTRLRRIAAPAFTRAKMPAYEARVAEITAALIDRAPDDFDLVSDFAGPLPITVIRELLGIPAADDAVFARYGQVAGAALDVSSVRQLNEVTEVSIALRQLFAELIELRTAEPGDDVISTLVAALGEDRLTAEELVTTAGLLLLAGFETTVNLLGNGVRLLLDHPAQWRALCDEPELAPRVVEEVLRYETPFQYGVRFTHEPVEVETGHGLVRLPADAPVMIMFGLANRDPAVFTRPDQFDIHQQRNTEHLAFASGAHYCLGAPLARLEGAVAFKTLATRLPGLRRNGSVGWRPSSLVRGITSLPVRK